VSAINVPESKVDERIMPLLKTIEKKWEPRQESEILEMNVEDL